MEAMTLITEKHSGRTTTLTMKYTSSSRSVHILGSKWEVPYMEINRERHGLMKIYLHFQEEMYVCLYAYVRVCSVLCE